jgi:hypothetical protein|tara:strand:+ start:13507 stop:13731 length:225 start_codon:yes stop_codon:yes gene_type:complete
MADNKYDNSGALWKREPRETDKAGVKYPHYQGNVTIGGVKKNLAAWLNTEKKENQPDISLKISEIQEKADKAPF